MLRAARPRRRTTAGLAGCAVVLALALGCAADRRLEAAEQQEAAGDLAGAQQILEAEQARRPDSLEVRLDLGEVHYKRARAALDGSLRDEEAYLKHLEAALREFVAAAEIDPTSYQVHFWLAVMDAYRGDIHGTLRGLANAHRLQPRNPFGYTNIAETYVYLGELEKARRWNDAGAVRGADPGAVDFNDMLIAWRGGNLRVARREFGRLKSLYPDQLQTINVARLPHVPADFEEFAGYCCASPACGPYMEEACRALGAPVRSQQLSPEAALRELRIEMEQKRRLQTIYQKRKELDIQVEPGDEQAPGGAGSPGSR